MNPHALYVHVPFCVRKCSYCDFYSVAGRQELVRPYLHALDLELRKYRTIMDLRTIYMGGGTPTALSIEDLAQLLDIIGDTAEEYTVEANPGTVDADKLAMMRAKGVNRVSLGVQSFNDRTLATLGRIHSGAEAIDAVTLCRESGYDNVSLDLIFGTPGQSVEMLRADLMSAVALSPEHISAYGLTYEEGTPMWRELMAGRLERAGEETELLMYREVRERLAEAGYEHYEISNYARLGRRARHNVTYWKNEAYVGVGPGAARYVDGVRCRNVEDIVKYVELIDSTGDATDVREELGPQKRAGETAMLGLRMTEGIDESEFAARTGFTPTELAGEALEGFIEQGLMSRTGGRLHLTERGMEVADSILSEFV